MLFDTHAHYDDEWFDEDRDTLLSSMPEHNVGLLLNPGCTIETSETAIQLAEQYDFMYAAVGIHPEYSMGVDEIQVVSKLRELAKHPKVKAIGEIGLDYYWEKRSPETTPPREQQKKLLRAQLELARELKMPVIIHDREAHEDCFDIVKEYGDLRGVYHCYSGSLEYAKEILKLGWYLSFTGVITYGRAKKARRIIEALPMERIMIETDSPYLTPEPERLQQKRVRNSSLFVHRVAEQIADFKGLSVQEVEDITLANGKRFFGIL